MNKLVVRRAAQLDVRSIREWYEGNEVGLGDRFLAELDEVVGRVRMAPAQFPEVGRSLRRALLRRFPYSVYFLDRGDAVILLAVLHQHRNPSQWQRRPQRREG